MKEKNEKVYIVEDGSEALFPRFVAHDEKTKSLGDWLKTLEKSGEMLSIHFGTPGSVLYVFNKQEHMNEFLIKALEIVDSNVIRFTKNPIDLKVFEGKNTYEKICSFYNGIVNLGPEQLDACPLFTRFYSKSA